MKRQIQVLLQHKKNNADAYTRVYTSLCRVYGEVRVNNAIAKEESLND